MGYHSEWDTDYEGAAHNLKYKYGIDWSPDMKSKLDNYASLYDRFIKLADALEMAKKDKASFEAKNLWDQA